MFLFMHNFLLVFVHHYSTTTSTGLNALLFDNYDDDDNNGGNKEKENDKANDCRVSAVFLDFDNLSFSFCDVGRVGSEGSLVDCTARVLHRVVWFPVDWAFIVRTRSVLRIVRVRRFFIRPIRSVTALVGVRRRT